MFQNIRNDVEYVYEDVEEEKNNKIKRILHGLFTKQNLIIYIISFMVSTVGLVNNINPFAIAILSAICSNDIPIGIVYILTLIGTGIGFGKESVLIYILESVIFLISMYFLKVKIDDTNNYKKMTTRLFFAVLITQIIKTIFNGAILFDILNSVTYIVACLIFYKVFTSAINVIKESSEKNVFSVEEVLATGLLISIAISGFKDITIFSFSLKNILSILIVLVLGWKNGILVGATGGITIGLVLGIIGGQDITQVASYAISGMIAGLLNRFGKIGVIIGFILGNAFITFIANGNSNDLIIFKEILIASIGLLALPKKININIEDLFTKDKYLPVTVNNKLKENEETIYKLNNVSEVIHDVAQSYKEVAATVVEKEDIEEKNYNVFKNELEKNIDELEGNILFDSFIENKYIYLDIFNKVINQEYITKNNLIEIFEKNNNYIIEVDDERTNKKIDQDINDVIRAINSAYRVYKTSCIYDKKIQNSKNNMGNQLEGISKAINSIVDTLSEEKDNNEETEEINEIIELFKRRGIDVNQVKVNKNINNKTEVDVYTTVCNSNKIEECKCEKIEKILNKKFDEKLKLVNDICNRSSGHDICKLKYISDDKYNIQVGIAKTTKHNSPISGDSSLNIKLEDGKKLIAISDGMGSGPKARQSSNIAVKLLKRLLLSGFDKETSVDLINSSICLNSNEETYATLDIAIFDLYKGNVEFIKNGACPTYIKNKKNVDIIKNASIPAGILDNIELELYDRDIEDNDILVMCSDGIIESNTEYENKELWLKYLLENIETENVQKIADLILQEAIDNCVGQAKDDMTVIVMKINKKQI